MAVGGAKQMWKFCLATATVCAEWKGGGGGRNGLSVCERDH